MRQFIDIDININIGTGLPARTMSTRSPSRSRRAPQWRPEPGASQAHAMVARTR
jgi:hypothetical protein